jgi:hypothetical protein
MRGRIWLKYFMRVIETEYPNNKKSWTDSEWTEFLGGVLDRVAKKMNCEVARRRLKNKEGSGEYFNIDAVFIDKSEYDYIEEDIEWDPFVLPRTVVELENSYDFQKISYCLWKIFCIRAPIRVLICYQDNSTKIQSLKRHLENVIWQENLTKGDSGDLLVIVGDDSKEDESEWNEYFNIFEWRNDRLEEIELLKW